MHAIRAGDTTSSAALLSEIPGLASAQIHGTRTPLLVAADWPGYFPNGPAIVRLLIQAGSAMTTARYRVRRQSASSGRRSPVTVPERLPERARRHRSRSAPAKRVIHGAESALIVTVDAVRVDTVQHLGCVPGPLRHLAGGARRSSTSEPGIGR